jgi:hypothetical protein
VPFFLCLAYNALSRKPRRFEKNAPYRENAHHARRSLHDIVEKLTATIRFVVRSSLLVGNGRVRQVRTGSDSDRVLLRKVFALRAWLQDGSLRSDGSLRPSNFDL